MERAHQIGLGHHPRNEFFTYYFFLTGIHGLHLLIGFTVVLWASPPTFRSPDRGRRSQQLVETAQPLAYRRFPVGAYLRDALRGEVDDEYRFQQEVDDGVADPVGT